VTTFILGAIGAVAAWFLAEFVGRPMRRFFDLRREINRLLVEYGNVFARYKDLTRDNSITGMSISTPEEVRLATAETELRKFAAEMRAFSNGEYFANRVVKLLGYDANKIASALIGYSNNIGTYGQMRHDSYQQVEKLLRIKSEE